MYAVQPVLETMIDKANHIYNRWSDGQELPTIVLKHVTDVEYSPDSDYANGDSVSMYNQPVQFAPPQQQYAPQKTQSDSFGRSHRSLTQCIIEAHQRAKSIFPLRKPCQCSAKVAHHCPPSHSWSPLPKGGAQTSPVLPPELPAVHLSRVSPGPGPGGYPVNGSPVPYGAEGARGYSPVSNGHQSQAYGNHLQFEGIYTNTVLPVDGPPVPASMALLSPTSKLAVVDTINFELGALNSSSEPWMAFF